MAFWVEGWLMGFTICYSFQGKRVVIECQNDNLCSHDAVYFSMLHAGIALQKEVSNWDGSYLSMIEVAERFGLTDVSWHRSLAHSH